LLKADFGTVGKPKIHGRVASFQEGDQWVLELDLDPGYLRAAEVPQFDEMAKAF